MKTKTVFSSCRQYRYTLWRVWDDALPYAMFIGLNPSTADEVEDDPTIRRCIGYAKAWGYGGLCMTNMFAYRSTDPKVLKGVSDPVGKDNDKWIRRMVKEAGVVVAAWGDHGVLHRRAETVTRMVPNISCLRLNKTGQPAHPLYLPLGLEPVPLLG